MAKSIEQLRERFDGILADIKGNPITEFTKMAEMAYEALICVKTINEYSKVYGPPLKIENPDAFLNQKPGRFISTKAFKVNFSEKSFYFATDVECFGLAAFETGKPIGDIFEADVVVINTDHEYEIENTFGGYPAPQHLDAAYECKFGAYHKSQLREMLGFRRHLSYCSNNHISSKIEPFGLLTEKCVPKIQMIMFRSKNLPFLQLETADFYDLHQIVF